LERRVVVIGSEALKYYVDGIEPKDLDLVGTYDEAVGFRKAFKATTFYPINGGSTIFMKNGEGRICEFEIAWEGSRADKLIKFLMKDDWAMFSPESYEAWVPGMDVLYLLKMSHRFLKDSPHFLKTMRDIQMMRKLGCRIRPEHQAFYEERMRDTYTYKHPKLGVGKGEFFDGAMTGVEQKYDHDSLHEAVAIGDRPAYEYFKPCFSEVMCSKELFDASSDYVKLCAVAEESYVLALERSLIPYPNGKTPEEAFKMALMKVCTSITSGWFREWAWEHYDEVSAFAADIWWDWYVEQFDIGVKDGTVKLKT